MSKNGMNETDMIKDLADKMGAKNAAVFIGEIIGEMMRATKPEAAVDTDELKKANAEFKSHIEYLTRENERLKGEIKGLRFAIRCNGVSGAEVNE